MAPAPAPMDGPPPLPKASDALALTNSTLNQLQVHCMASSHIVVLSAMVLTELLYAGTCMGSLNPTLST